MAHKFNPEFLHKLESSERKRNFPAAKILKLAGLKKGHHMIDYGAGTGFFAFPALNITGSNGSVTAFDIEPKMLDFLEEKAESILRKNRHHFSVTDDISRLTVNPDGADFFWMGNVLHEIDDPQAMLVKACSIMIEEGIIAILEWRKISTPGGPDLDHRFSEDDMRRMLIRSGFGRINCVNWNGTHFLTTAVKTGYAQFLPPPRKLNFILEILLGTAERKLGKKLRANRILGWYPKILIGTGIMEALTAHGDTEVSSRLLNLLRLYVSYSVSCPFCIDMNAVNFRKNSISEEEFKALKGRVPVEEINSFSDSEKAALKYASCISVTPVKVTMDDFINLRLFFSERAVTVIAATVSQVNFWARLIQGLGVNEAGFTSENEFLSLDEFRRKK